MSLSERAILTHLTLSVWSGTIGHDVTSSDLDPERDRVVHSVVPPNMLKDIKALAGTFRRRHYALSAPWDDNGLRLVPSQTLLNYTEVMRTQRDRLARAAEDLIPRLQNAMDPGYSDRFKDLTLRFGSVLTFYPVPDGDKLPLIVDTVTAAVRASIVDSMKEDAKTRTAEIRKNLITAAKKRITRLLHVETTGVALFNEADVAEALDNTAMLFKILVTIDPSLDYLQRKHISGFPAALLQDLEYLDAQQ